MSAAQTRPALQTINADLMQDLAQRAAAAPRKRVNHNFHADLDDPCHRFLNVLAADTYVTPHRHASPPKSESFVVLQGSLLFCVFDDTGALDAVHRLGPEAPALGIDITPGVWHSLLVEAEPAVVFEVKAGPYDPVSDKDFAPWAPREGAPAADEYQRNLLRRAREKLDHAG